MGSSGRMFTLLPRSQLLLLVHVFWDWDIEVFADVPMDYFKYSVVPLCVQLI